MFTIFLLFRPAKCLCVNFRQSTTIQNNNIQTKNSFQNIRKIIRCEHTNNTNKNRENCRTKKSKNKKNAFWKKLFIIGASTPVCASKTHRLNKQKQIKSLFFIVVGGTLARSISPPTIVCTTYSFCDCSVANNIPLALHIKTTWNFCTFQTNESLNSVERFKRMSFITSWKPKNLI